MKCFFVFVLVLSVSFSVSANTCVELFTRPSTIPDGFPQRLSEAIYESDFNQTELNSILQFVGTSKLSKAVTGKQILLFHDVLLVANVLRVNPWWLLTGEGEKNASAESATATLSPNIQKENFVEEWRVAYATKLRKIMRSSRITSLVLADYLGMTGGKISKVLAAQQEFMPNDAIETIRFLQVDPTELLEGPFVESASVVKEQTPVKEQMSVQGQLPLQEPNNLSIKDTLTRDLLEELLSRGWLIQDVGDGPLGASINGPGLILRTNKNPQK